MVIFRGLIQDRLDVIAKETLMKLFGYKTPNEIWGREISDL